MCAAVVAASSGTLPTAAQEGSAAQSEAVCVSDVEPNDTADGATAASGPACLAGTLPQGDQDLFLWEVSAADAQATWAISVDGVPGARTIVDLRPVTSEPGMQPLAVGGPLLVLTVESDATEPTVRGGLLLTPGRYIVGVSAGGQPTATGDQPLSVGDGSLTSPDQPLPPDGGLGYRLTLETGAPLPTSVEVEPNDDGDAGTPVRGAFALSGDLADSVDDYRWTVPQGAAAWTLTSVMQLGTTATLTLSNADGSSVLVRAQPTDGRIELPDLVLDPGEYLVSVGPAAAAASPYILTAQASETPTGDPEPNDLQDRAVPLAGEKPLVRGRLARPQDDDWFRFDIDEALAGGTVDIRMLWNSGLRRELCLYGAGPAALLCRESTSGLNVSGLSLSVGSYTLRVRGDAAPDDTYLIRVDPAGMVGAELRA